MAENYGSFHSLDVAENANKGEQQRKGTGGRSEQTEPQGHANKPRERHFLAIRGRYFAESIGRANLHRNQHTKTVFKGKSEKSH